MRALFVCLSLAIASLAWACSPAEDSGSVCDRAQSLFRRCGASVPMLSGASCTGAPRILAQCVTDHARDCDELATLGSRVDECLADAGDGLIPAAEDLPAPSFPDAAAGWDARVATDGQSSAPARDASVADAALDAPSDAGAWPGTDLSGTVALDQEQRVATPTLPAGAYTVTMTGTGDADLYVRAGAAPTTSTYDCRPFLPSSIESCAVTLTSPSTIHAMARGAASSSTFQIKIRP